MVKCLDRVRDLEEATELVKNYRVDVKAGRVFYTAVFGGYDEVQTPRGFGENELFFCFTDNSELRAEGWTIVVVDFKYQDPRRTARLFKCLSHLLFPNVDLSIWMDANFQMGHEFCKYFSNVKFSGFLCFPHPDRNCVYDEAAECERKGKESTQLLSDQVETYKINGMPSNFGLIASGVLIRCHKDCGVADFNVEWICQVSKFSSRDQIAFSYVAWKSGINYSLFPFTMDEAPGLRYVPHKRWISFGLDGKPQFSLRGWLWSKYYRFRHSRIFVSQEKR